MNPRKTCIWSQELCGHIFVRTRNEDAFLGEETRKKVIRSAVTPETEAAEVKCGMDPAVGSQRLKIDGRVSVGLI